jgi:hypothetical protein
MNRIGKSTLAARPLMVRLAFLVLVLALALSAGMVPARAEATTYKTNIFEQTDILVYVPCALGGMGEYVYLSGPLHILMVTTYNAGGGYMSKTHFQPQGISGVGQTSGVRYQATGGTQDTFTGRIGTTYTYINNFKIVGQGPGNNYMVHETFHYTVNANGSVTAYLDNFSVECKAVSYP